MDVVFLIGRILFGMRFVLSGLTAHMGRQGVEYAKAYGAPAPRVMVPPRGVAIIVGGAMVVLGIWADLVALVVGAFAVSISPIMHAFWKEQDPQMRVIQQSQFNKDLAWRGRR
jgi:putative oxidoreductase